MKCVHSFWYNGRNNISISLEIACTFEANSAYHNYWHRLSWQACTLSLDVRKNACKLALAWQQCCSVVAVRTLGLKILCRKIPSVNQNQYQVSVLVSVLKAGSDKKFISLNFSCMFLNPNIFCQFEL